MKPSVEVGAGGMVLCVSSMLTSALDFSDSVVAPECKEAADGCVQRGLSDAREQTNKSDGAE